MSVILDYGITGGGRRSPRQIGKSIPLFSRPSPIAALPGRAVSLRALRSTTFCSCDRTMGNARYLNGPRFGPMRGRCSAREEGAAAPASRALRYAMSGTGWYVRGMTAFVGQVGTAAGGPRSDASGAHRPKCSRMRRTTCGSSISAITRIGPLHLGHSSGSASYTLRISRAQADLARAANSLTGS